MSRDKVIRPWSAATIVHGGEHFYQIRTKKPHIPGGTVGSHIADVNPYLYPKVDEVMAVIAAAPEMLLALTTVAGKLGSYHDEANPERRAAIIHDIESTINPLLFQLRHIEVEQD